MMANIVSLPNNLTIIKETETYWRWLTREQLATDTREFSRHLASYPLRGVVGVFRSGGIVACNIATALNIPVYECNRNTGVITQLSNGWRIDNKQFQGKLLLVDDSTYNGGTTKVLQALKSPDVITAALYSTPNSSVKPNIVFKQMPRPFWVEWHFFGSAFISKSFVDAEVLKYYFARQYPVHTVYGDTTELAQYGAKWKQTSEGDKAKAFKNSGAKYCVIHNPTEAEALAEEIKYPIICPIAGKVFGNKYRLEMAF